MISRIQRFDKASLLLLALFTLVGVAPLGALEVDYARDIQPLLQKRCYRCHGPKKRKGKLRLDIKATAMLGGASGAVIVPGHPEMSELLRRITLHETDEEIMPASGKTLTSQEIELIRSWIKKGSSWPDDGSSHAVYRRAPLLPRRPDLPPVAADGMEHPVDRIVNAYFKEKGIAWPNPVDDRGYARRVYLDVIGLLPTPAEIEAFVTDTGANKERRLVRALLARSVDYAEHWLSFWNDALRNDVGGTGYREDGRHAITSWLYQALLSNMPYDQFVGDLMNPTSLSRGFTHGIKWRGTVNASQVQPIQAAQNVSQVLLGLNLKCASCHDSFISDWKLDDAYNFASIYATEALEIHRCEKPSGRMARPTFLFPELGRVDPDAPRPVRLAQTARAMTSKKNGRLTRTVANRFWARFFGHGLVEPVDEMDNPAWSADLLDWLAVDLADKGHDLHHLIERILTSGTYRLPSVILQEAPRGQADLVFRGPVVRRISGEQFVDAVSQLVANVYEEEEWQSAVELGDARVEPWKLESVLPVELDDELLKAQWIWRDSAARQSTPATSLYLKKVIDLPVQASTAYAYLVGDDRASLRVNEVKVGASGGATNPAQLRGIAEHLKPGSNVLTIEAKNQGKEPGPAGVWLFMRIQFDDGRADRIVVSDGSWRRADTVSQSWAAVPFRGGLLRAALVKNDPLQRALGRSTREQILTSRDSRATMLETFELANGEILSEVVRRGAEAVRQNHAKDPEAWIRDFYSRALGRKPTDDELALARGALGPDMDQEGCEDFIWAVLMLPEFQLIY